jgi:hypothetical protein
MKRAVFVLAAVLIFLTSGHARAQELELNPFIRDYSVSFRAARTFLSKSDFKDFWNTDETYDGFEVAVEHKFGRIGGVELVYGTSKYRTDVDNIFFVGDDLDIEMSNKYFSLSAKQYLQLSSKFALYAGGGPDYYKTDLKYDYTAFGFSNSGSNEYKTYGIHCLLGAEYIIYDDPFAHGEFDAPVSLHIEYRYSWVNIENADEDLIDAVNNAMGTSYNSHDFNIGGHTGIIGIRWRF